MSTDLPEEIIMNILSRLPVKSILRFRCVCKSWFDLFRNTNFVKMHLNHQNKFTIMIHNETREVGKRPVNHVYAIDYDLSTSTCYEAIEIDYPLISSSYHYITIWGSCNGLVCLSYGVNEAICLWNPSTKEYKDIPAPIAPFQWATFGYAFSYDSTIDEYKLIRLQVVLGEKCCDVFIYTLGSNSWRIIESIPYRLDIQSLPEWTRVPVNGAHHWIAISYMGSKPSKVILSFNVADERFQEMPLPNCLDEIDKKKKCLDERFNTYVGVLGGDLCLLDYFSLDRSPKYLDVWVMKDYGVLESWTKLFTIDIGTPVGSFNFLMPMQSLKNGEIVFVKDSNALLLYDPKHETTRTLKVFNNLQWSHYDTSAYVGSLVSLNSGTYARRNRRLERTQ